MSLSNVSDRTNQERRRNAPGFRSEKQAVAYFWYQRDDGTFKFEIFTEEDELHTGIFSLAFKAEILTVYSITQVFFTDGFQVRL